MRAPDLLLYGQRVLNTELLTLPHPCLQQRRFALQPLAEVAAQMHVPELPVASQLCAGLRDRTEDQSVERVEAPEVWSGDVVRKFPTALRASSRPATRTTGHAQTASKTAPMSSDAV